jgi:hypothetical protein
MRAAPHARAVGPVQTRANSAMARLRVSNARRFHVSEAGRLFKAGVTLRELQGEVAVDPNVSIIIQHA